jgi:DNA-binding response OmpR family regulator
MDGDVAKILLVEDDVELVGSLKDWLTLENHVLELATNGEDALQMLRLFAFDVVVLDWSLPGLSGYEICKQFRDEGGHTPIIFLTGRSDIASREAGLDCGADDYLVKPFDPRELSARIRSLLRRPAVTLAPELRAGDLVLNPMTRMLTGNGGSVQLKPKECSLLEFLMRHPNQTFHSKELLEAVWSSDSDASSDSVRTWMKFLHGQLKTIGKGELIKTVLGSGYLLQIVYGTDVEKHDE